MTGRQSEVNSSLTTFLARAQARVEASSIASAGSAEADSVDHDPKAGRAVTVCAVELTKRDEWRTTLSCDCYYVARGSEGHEGSQYVLHDGNQEIKGFVLMLPGSNARL